MTDAPRPVADLGYQEALTELESILDRLEQDVPDVDRVAADVARAAEIVEHCRGRIVAARSGIEAVVATFDADEADGGDHDAGPADDD